MVGPLQSQDAETRRVSDRILEAVSEAEGTDPTDFDRRLYEVIDPDALDSLFRSDGTDMKVAFTYLGYEVTVHGNGTIDLTPLDE